ncbi:MAG: hypothetical protein JJT75_14765, partial [Opitutales bacterium]|nr:hypothetical protein [Opitutales bacterium]
RSSAAVPAAVSSPGGNFNYTANALNQYTAIENGAPVNPAHDLDGNLINDGKGTTFEWNGENRMVRVHKGDLTIENTYDGQGRRVRKLVIDDGTPIEDHRYFYDGWNLIFEYDEINPHENTRYYICGLHLSQSLQGAGGVGGLLLVRQGNELHAPTYDANGNISEYIDLSDGSITAHLEYDAFGRKIVSTGTAPSNFGFSTKYEDTETGYLYYGFRYYDPETGRWPNRDPIGEEGGENIYGFIFNSPIKNIDLFGLLNWSYEVEEGCCPDEIFNDPDAALVRLKAFGTELLRSITLADQILRSSRRTGDSDCYAKFFGANSRNARRKAREGLENLKGKLNQDLKFVDGCSEQEITMPNGAVARFNPCLGNTDASTVRNLLPNTIFLCKNYWTDVVTEKRRMELIAHEALHLVSDDFIDFPIDPFSNREEFEQALSNLAVSNQNNALNNPDNFAAFLSCISEAIPVPAITPMPAP